jgi:hypothetical protein
MITLRTEQEVRELKQEHWKIATADRNIANSLKVLQRVFQICKANEENSK